MTPLPDPKEVAHALILDNSVNDDGYRKIIRVDLLEQRIESSLRARDEWWKAQHERDKASIQAFWDLAEKYGRPRMSSRHHALSWLDDKLEAAQAQQAEMVKALESISSCVCMADLDSRGMPLVNHGIRPRPAVLAKIRGQ